MALSRKVPESRPGRTDEDGVQRYVARGGSETGLRGRSRALNAIVRSMGHRRRRRHHSVCYLCVARPRGYLVPRGRFRIDARRWRAHLSSLFLELFRNSLIEAIKLAPQMS